MPETVEGPDITIAVLFHVQLVQQGIQQFAWRLPEHPVGRLEPLRLRYGSKGRNTPGIDLRSRFRAYRAPRFPGCARGWIRLRRSRCRAVQGAMSHRALALCSHEQDIVVQGLADRSQRGFWGFFARSRAAS